MGWEVERDEEGILTVFRAMEVDVELLHPIVDHIHLVIAHHPEQETKEEIQDLDRNNSYEGGREGIHLLTAS